MHVLVHGGAGSAPDAPETRQDVLETAARDALDGSVPLDAAVTAVRRLESAPRFNAGVGSAVRSDGSIRTDAGVMAADGRCGAACAMANVEHAVDVAAAVAEETPHVCLAGESAAEFADSVGVETDRDLWTDASRARWAEADPPPTSEPTAHRAWVREHYDGTDTVGAVVADGEQVVAATSTGGRWFALPGRVGDVPQVGAGFYASDAAAASATGAGEAIARTGVARRAVEAVGDGATPQDAAASAIEALEESTGETAGVILATPDGRTGSAHNAEAMQTAAVAER